MLESKLVSTAIGSYHDEVKMRVTIIEHFNNNAIEVLSFTIAELNRLFMSHKNAIWSGYGYVFLLKSKWFDNSHINFSITKNYLST